MTNFDLSQKIFSFLKTANVENIIICAGARNAPLIFNLEKENFKTMHFFEERSAAFFALGLIKATGKPVAVMTTSGTAAAEILPAAIEATYQGLPLLIVTADRPKTYRHTGAPQAIEQIGLFSHYVEQTYDLDVDSKDFKFEWSFQKPIHLNICFDEPLLDKATALSTVDDVVIHQTKLSQPQAEAEIRVSHPLVIVGQLESKDVETVKHFLNQSKALVYYEALSQLSSSEKQSDYTLKSSDLLLSKLFKEKKCHSVIRIGGVPTTRLWRDLENQFSDVPVYNFSNLAYSGLARASETYEIKHLLKTKVEIKDESYYQTLELDRQLQNSKSALIEKYPLSEPGFIFWLSHRIKSHPLYLGNSLPIRNWDFFADAQSTAIYANRGANGIDGQISSYLGWSEIFEKSYCVVGDLTALYDLASLGLTEQLKKNKRRIVVINNFGGQIFNRIFKNDIFINQHQIEFSHWAKMWNWDYVKIQSLKNVNQSELVNSQNVIVEVQPDAEQTKMFLNEWDLICQKI